MHRLLPILILTLCCSTAHAGLTFGSVTFYDSTAPGSPGTVSFAADGSLTLTAQIDTATESQGPLAGLSLAITGGSLTFTLGTPDFASANLFGYAPGGSLLLTGALPGLTPQTLASGSFYAPDDVSTFPGPDWRVDAPNWQGTIPLELEQAFGIPFGIAYIGQVTALFSGTPGGDNTLVLASFTVEFLYDSATVPEPASVAMLAMGLGAVALTRLRRRVRI